MSASLRCRPHGAPKRPTSLRRGTARRGQDPNRKYLDPKSMQDDGLLGWFSKFWAILLHTFGVQVQS